MPQRRESFLLDRSPQFNLTTGGENRTDLALSPNPYMNYSGIRGTVLTGSTPVPNALVKVLTQTGNPIDHQFTNETGIYVSKPLLAGIYQVVATAPGFLTSAPVIINLPVATAGFANFNLAPDPRAVKNTLYGLVLDQSTGNRIPTASVVLTDTQGQTVAETETNTDGEYLICEITNGSYLITAEKPGYQLAIPLTVTVAGSQLAQTNITLIPESVILGTVSGFIKDQSANFLAGACVGLYSVTDSTETLIQTTTTNVGGYYLFGNVPAGNYVVKAKQDVLL